MNCAEAAPAEWRSRLVELLSPRAFAERGAIQATASTPDVRNGDPFSQRYRPMPGSRRLLSTQSRRSEGASRSDYNEIKSLEENS